MPLALAQWIGLLRFFRVMPPVPSMLVGCFAVIVIVFVVAALAGIAAPGAAAVPVLFVQLFAAASGFAAPARRGYFDLLLARGERRSLIAVAHWSSSTTPGVAAWLVIVAAEMLTGRPGVGGFLWQEYNSLIYEHIILCIVTIGVVGFVLDRLMSVVEKRFKTA